MKKYFMTGTDDELEYGDIIEMLNEVLEMQKEQAKLLDKLADRLIELEGVIADIEDTLSKKKK